MSATIRIHNPEAQPRVAEGRGAPPLSDLRGKRVGFVDNGWRSFGTMIQRLQDLLRERAGVVECVAYRKPWLPRPLEEHAFQDLVRRCDAVVVGLGN